MAKSGDGAFRIVGGVFAVAGLILLGVCYWTAKRQYTILTTWPTVEGEVAGSRVTHSTSHDSKRAQTSDMYRAEIDFRYNVGGKEHVTPATSAYSSSSYREMKRKADARPVGSRQIIRVNPKDHDDIRYDAGWTLGFFLFPLLFGGMGVVFFGLGATFLFLIHPTPARLCSACGGEVTGSQRFCPNCGRPLSSS